MDALAGLFCSPARVKLLRLFMFNATDAYTSSEIAFRAKINTTIARKEIAALINVGVIRKRGTGKNATYSTNRNFVYFEALSTFLRETTVVGPSKILDILRRAGTLRLVVLTGLFLGLIESKIDLLIVGDRINERVLTSAIHTIEADLGREIRYALFSTEDFRYRFGIYDRLLRDVFDYRPRIILDKIGVK